MRIWHFIRKLQHSYSCLSSSYSVFVVVSDPLIFGNFMRSALGKIKIDEKIKILSFKETCWIQRKSFFYQICLRFLWILSELWINLRQQIKRLYSWIHFVFNIFVECIEDYIRWPPDLRFTNGWNLEHAQL